MASVDTAVSSGVSFTITDEQKDAARARAGVRDEGDPAEGGRVRRAMTHPADVIAKAHEVGLMNLHVPAEYGGLGLSAFDGMLVAEELNWGCTGIGTSLGANGLGSGPVIVAGTDEQKATWLPPLVESPMLCSFGLSEPEAGSDVARLKTTAERKGGEYVLNGSKTFITNAGYADWTVVFAKTDVSKGHRGMSAFIVPMDTPGVTIEQQLDKMGQRATDTSAFALQDVVVPAANRLGEEGEGFKLAMQTLDFTRPGTAIGAVGVARPRTSSRRVRQGARHVRHADRDAPGRQLHDRRHGDRVRLRGSSLAGRMDARPRRARHACSSFAKRFAPTRR